jgi:rhodanese-related sulfurtransferase
MKRTFTKILGALLLATGCIAISVSAQSTNSSPGSAASKAVHSRRVGVDEFEKLWLTHTNTVLDVRSEKEFAAGHIPGAINIDVNGADFDKQIKELDRKKVYLVHCAAGVRSARACSKMETLGFENLVDLAPGFRGWSSAGKPVEKK